MNSFDKCKLKRYWEDLAGCVNLDEIVKKLQESNITLSSGQEKTIALKKTPRKTVKNLFDILAVLPNNAFQALVDLLINTNQQNFGSFR